MHQILFSLLLVLLPTQLGYHFWPEWALVLGRRIDYLSPTLYLTDILILFLLVAWCISKRKIFFSKWKIKKSFIIAGIIFFIFIFLNIYFSAGREVALFAWIQVLEFAGLSLYIVHTKPKFSQIIFPLSVGLLYSSAIAITQFFLGRSIGGLFWFLGERTFTSATPGISQTPLCFPDQLNCPLVLRAYGTFSHPNVLGGFIAVSVPLILFQLSKRKNLYYLITLGFAMLALIVSFSRSAWVVFFLGVSFFAARKYKGKFLQIILSTILLLFFIASTFGFKDESIVVRGQLNTAAISMFLKSPIVGNGLGNYLVRLPDYLVSRSVYFLQPAHNIYLLILSETGIAGALIFLWILWKAVKNNSGKYFIFRVSFFLLCLLGLVDHYPMTLQTGQLLFVIFLSLSLIQ